MQTITGHEMYSWVKYDILVAFPRRLSENRHLEAYAIGSKWKRFRKNKHSHICDIEVSLRLLIYEHSFLGNNEEFGRNGILGQTPSVLSSKNYLQDTGIIFISCRLRLIEHSSAM